MAIDNERATADDCDPIAAAARFLAAYGPVDSVLRKHERRPDGQCAECSGPKLVTWPCTLVSIARSAAKLAPD